jgi:hypothetical protein
VASRRKIEIVDHLNEKGVIPINPMTSDDLLLEILCLAGGSVNWTVTCVAEQWGDEEPPEGPLFFDSQEREIQIVSPVSVGLTTADLVAYILAENRHQEFCDLHMTGVNLEDRIVAEADALLQTVQVQFAHIQTAIEATAQGCSLQRGE